MAIPQYREVLKLRPDEVVGHTNLACALAEQENWILQSKNTKKR